jgi:RNAse (barnase) inhibitor barstar
VSIYQGVLLKNEVHQCPELGQARMRQGFITIQLPTEHRAVGRLWDRLSRDIPRPVRLVWTYWHVSERSLGAERFGKICDLLRAVQAEDQELGYEERFEFELR